jgi:CP family cyanate transporter-like MFS transporter
MLVYADRLTRRRWPFIVLATTAVAALSGLLLMPDAWIVPWCGVLGFCNAFMLILTLALPPLIARAEDVHRLSAAMLAIGYLCAFLTPIAGGLAWDATGIAAAAFAPILAFGLAALGIAARLDFRGNSP